MLAEQVAGGDLRDAELVHQQLGLCALADAGRAEQQHGAGEEIARVGKGLHRKARNRKQEIGSRESR
jgi:hypothetical protein